TRLRRLRARGSQQPSAHPVAFGSYDLQGSVLGIAPVACLLPRGSTDPAPAVVAIPGSLETYESRQRSQDAALTTQPELLTRQLVQIRVAGEQARCKIERLSQSADRLQLRRPAGFQSANGFTRHSSAVGQVQVRETGLCPPVAQTRHRS